MKNKILLIFLLFLTLTLSQDASYLQSGHGLFTPANSSHTIYLTDVINPSSIIGSIYSIKSSVDNTNNLYKFQIKCILLGGSTVNCQFLNYNPSFIWSSVQYVYMVSNSSSVRLGSIVQNITNSNRTINIIIPQIPPINQLNQIEPYIFISGINTTKNNYSLRIENQFYSKKDNKIYFDLLFDCGHNNSSTLVFSYILVQYGQDLIIEGLLDHHLYPTQEDYFIGIRQIHKSQCSNSLFCRSPQAFDKNVQFIKANQQFPFRQRQFNQFFKCVNYCKAKNKRNQEKCFNFQDSLTSIQSCRCEIIKGIDGCYNPFEYAQTISSFTQIEDILLNVEGIVFKSYDLYSDPLSFLIPQQSQRKLQQITNPSIINNYIPLPKTLPTFSPLSSRCSLIQKQRIQRVNQLNSRRIRKRLNYIECQSQSQIKSRKNRFKY